MMALSEICYLQTEKVLFDSLLSSSYIPTENMITDKGGITAATTAPFGRKTTSCKSGDVLVSNIRPYLKKTWQADCKGGCSNDVLVFRASETDSDFLYYILSDDSFFDYSTKSAKGTKMPREDKTTIMRYPVPDVGRKTQKAISACLKPIDARIAVDNRINDYLPDYAENHKKLKVSRI